MKCQGKFVKLFAIFVIGLFLIGFASTGIDNVVNPQRAQFVYDYHQLNDGHWVPNEIWGESENHPPLLLIYLIRIIFILFFISPPLIVVLLFLIWRELKRKNERE